MTFYTNPHSRSQIVAWMLEEIGEPYEIKPLQYGEEMKHPNYLKINPMGKVPTLVHDNNIVTECAAICSYLATVYPEKKLLPKNPKEYAEYFRWLFFASGPLEMAITLNNLKVEVPTEKERMVGCGNFELTVSALATGLRRKKYVAGDHFTAADVYVASQIGWGLEFGTLPKKSEFIDYWNQHKERPALLTAKQKGETLAQEMGLSSTGRT